jgi:tetratricopeptide (TPR) repeat protein
MKIQLPYPDDLHFRSAQGWLELGNSMEATKEIEKISAALQGHPGVLELKWHLHAHAKNWQACVAVADETIKAAPHRPEGWIHRSFALHELKRTQEALENLLPAAHQFPAVWTIPYNLACYCAQQERLDESMAWLTKALAIDADTVKSAAVSDPDLKPLRDRFGTLWSGG